MGLSISLIVVGTAKYAWAFSASIKTSQVMFDNVMYRVLRAPLRWLDTVPVGRILNRFTADFNVLDSRMVRDLAMFLYAFLDLLGISIAGFIVSPIMILFAAILMSTAAFIGTRYLSGALEVKRLESVAKSPILEQFGSVLAGVATIRAFGKVEEYIDRYGPLNFQLNHLHVGWLLMKAL